MITPRPSIHTALYVTLYVLFYPCYSVKCTVNVKSAFFDNDISHFGPKTLDWHLKSLFHLFSYPIPMKETIELHVMPVTSEMIQQLSNNTDLFNF